MDDASLSRMCKIGWFPLLVSVDNIIIVVYLISVSLRVLVGINCMLLILFQVPGGIYFHLKP